MTRHTFGCSLVARRIISGRLHHFVLPAERLDLGEVP